MKLPEDLTFSHELSCHAAAAAFLSEGQRTAWTPCTLLSWTHGCICRCLLSYVLSHPLAPTTDYQRTHGQHHALLGIEVGQGAHDVPMLRSRLYTWLWPVSNNVVLMIS